MTEGVIVYLFVGVFFVVVIFAICLSIWAQEKVLDRDERIADLESTVYILVRRLKKNRRVERKGREMTEPIDYEAEVRAAWKDVFPKKIGNSPEDQSFIVIIGDDYTWGENELEAWEIAYVFTRERREQIAEVKEEVEWVESVVDGIDTLPARQRILSRLNAVLEDLLQGWKGE